MAFRIEALHLPLIRLNPNNNKVMKKTTLLLLGGLTLGMISCSDDDDDKDMNVVAPATYAFERDGSSTVSYSGQTTRIAMATELVDAFGDATNTPAKLLEMWANETASGQDADPFSDPALNSSTKSVKSKVAASRDFFASNTVDAAAIKADFESWINAQFSEVWPKSGEAASAGQAGQIADGSKARYVSAKGLEYNQAFNKGLIGGLMADQMVNNYLSPSVLDDGSNRADNDAGTIAEGKTYTTMEHKWDEAYGYLFGLSTDGANPLATLGEDKFLNKYLSRVEGDADFAGIAQKIYDAFKLGRAAIVAKNYTMRDAQADIIQKEVAHVIAVRAIYYLQQGKKALADGNWGGAFHDLSEGFGFVYSLQFLQNPSSNTAYFSKSTVDGYLSTLMSGNGFWDVTAAELDQISDAIADKFDFTVAQAAE